MSVYKFPLKDYGSDVFSFPLQCDSAQFQFTLSWDAISQAHYDNLMSDLRTRGIANPLVVAPNYDEPQENSDFLGYLDGLRDILSEFLSRQSAWVNQLLLNPGDTDWGSMSSDISLLITLFSSQKISMNHFSKMKNFLSYLSELSAAAQSQLVSVTLSKWQNYPGELFTYIHSYDDWETELKAEFDDLEELMRWAVSVEYQGVIKTTSLEIGAPHFEGDSDYRIMFTADYEPIKRQDIGNVTLWVEVFDGA